MITAAATEWPDAAIAIAGIVLAIAVIVGIIVAIASTLRARMSIQREEAYRRLAEESQVAMSRTASQLERAVAELGELKARTGELEKVLKTVE